MLILNSILLNSSDYFIQPKEKDWLSDSRVKKCEKTISESNNNNTQNYELFKFSTEWFQWNILNYIKILLIIKCRTYLYKAPFQIWIHKAKKIHFYDYCLANSFMKGHSLCQKGASNFIGKNGSRIPGVDFNKAVQVKN